MAAFYAAASDDELGGRYIERARIYRECADDLEADLRDWADCLGLAAEYACAGLEVVSGDANRPESTG